LSGSVATAGRRSPDRPGGRPDRPSDGGGGNAHHQVSTPGV